jgi:hypothetical protein
MSVTAYLKTLCFSCVIIYISGCTPYVSKPQVDAKHEPSKDYVYVEAPLSEKKSNNQTFLDTLNLGKEVSVVENNPKLLIKSGNIHSENVQSETANLYRIQIMASSRIESLREQKKMIEKKIKVPLNIVFEAPFYKLYAGHYSQRSDADAALIQIRKLGYPDAWIVSPRILKK